MSNANPAWYREPTMLVVAGVLSFTLLSGTAMLTLSVTDRDVLMLEDADYQAWRDQMRAATPIQAPGETPLTADQND